MRNILSKGIGSLVLCGPPRLGSAQCVLLGKKVVQKWEGSFLILYVACSVRDISVIRSTVLIGLN